MRARTGPLLAVLLAGQFMANVDSAIVNVATPAIRDDLHASGGQLEFVVSGYVLAYAVLLITGARLGEIRGYRTVFLGGLGVFTLASLLCGVAPDAGILIGARIVQGVGAALMVPQVLTGIQLNFTEAAARTRAMGLFVLTLSGAAVVGQALGGILVTADLFGSGWRPVFGINVPIGIGLLAAAARYLPAGSGTGARRLDLRGASTLSAALLLAVVPLVFGREQHWPAWTWTCLAASVPATVLFVRVERRVLAGGGQPLVNLHLLARRDVAWGLLGNGAATSTYFSTLFVLALYLQQGLGRSALYSGLSLVTWVAAFGVAGPLLRRLPASIAPHAASVGCLVLGSAYLAISLSHAVGAPLVAILTLGGLGLGLQFGAVIGSLTSSVPAASAPDMTGLITTNSQLFGVAGVATFGTVYLSLADRPGASHATHAFGVVMAASAATALAAALCLNHRRAAASRGPESTHGVPSEAQASPSHRVPERAVGR